MPALLLVLVLLLAGCVPGVGRTASDGIPTADAPFTLVALDVGQGDALLVRTRTVTMLVDTGEPDAGVVAALRRNGVRQVDLLVVTHSHLDHVGGAPAVLATFPVGEVWMNLPPSGVTVVDQVAATLRLATEKGVPVRGPPAGTRVAIGDLRLEVLGPPVGRPYALTRSEPNNTSIVLRASVAGGGSILMAGDIELEAQQDLLLTYGVRLRSDVLVVPHHGSRTSDPAFFAAVDAHTAVISVGRSNRHGHPHPDTMTALEALEMRILRTDRLGDVRILVVAHSRVPA